MVSGKYVKSFCEASHVLPENMHMNADYPLMLPKIEKLENGIVTLSGDDQKEYSAKIIKRNGQEYCRIAQSSLFERIFHRKPTMFMFYPFKDEKIKSISEQSKQTEISL
jgi:hypothetical protein